AAKNLVAVIIEDLRTGPTWSRVAHSPEIVGAGDANDAGFRQAGNLPPQSERLVVVDVNRRGQFVFRQPELFGHQVPGELDRAILEIVAEREVAEHLKEGVMTGGVADIIEVVVLAAGAHAFLRGGG